MSKSLFIVTSALNTRFGIYDNKQRFQQTVDTFKSIYAKCNADIILVDAGQEKISEQDVSLLKVYAGNILQHSDDPIVKSVQKNTNCDVVKSLLEILILKSAFTELLKNKELVSKYNRIFKLSGRYVLNGNFDYQKHIDATNKITIKSSLPSIYSTDHWAIKESATEYYRQYMTRLWSFDVSLLQSMIDTYQKMQDNLVELLNKSRFMDIEHLMYRHLDSNLITEFNTIGVQGTIAPNGVLFID